MKLILRQTNGVETAHSWIWDTRFPMKIGKREPILLEWVDDEIQIRKGLELIRKNSKEFLKDGLTVPLSKAVRLEIQRFSPQDLGFLKAPAKAEAPDVLPAMAKRAFVVASVCMLSFFAMIRTQPEEPKETVIPVNTAKMLAALNPVSAAPATGQAGGSRQAIAQAKADVVKSLSVLKKGSMISAFKSSHGLFASALKSSAMQNLSQSRTIASVDQKVAVGLAASGVSVGTLGGGSGGQGYSQSKGAGIAGQGKQFVELDLGHGVVEEGLTKDEVGQVIHSHMSEIRYCYESIILKNPQVEGKLLVDFTILNAGQVGSSAVKEASVQGSELGNCILGRLNHWKFPKPKGAVKVAVTYPFIFKTLGR